MGSQTARDIASEVNEGLTNLEAALTYHFRSNHYPPLPLSLIPIAVKIIQGHYTEDDVVDLPEGIYWKNQTFAPVPACIEAWHLDAFLLNPDDYE